MTTPTGIEISNLAERLVTISLWIDRSPANQDRPLEAQTWGRVAKVAEEAGEVIAAMIAVTGQNPRKGQHGSWNDIRNELLDVALTALAAVEHLDGHQGGAVSALAAHVRAVSERAGLE